MATDRGEAPAPRRWYPILLDLSDRIVLIVGGGMVAERKIRTLVSYGAHPRLIAPKVTEHIRELALTDDLFWEARVYRPGDCAGAFVVFAATDSREVNEMVAREAREYSCLINVADDPVACDALVPSSFSRGMLQIAVSTDGASPVLARQIREEQQRSYGPEYQAYVALLGGVRKLACTSILDENTRRDLIARSCDGSLLERLRSGEVLDAEDVFEELNSGRSSYGKPHDGAARGEDET